jgi:hypothetical protein
MRIFKKAAVSMTAAGLLAFGAVSGGGGAALASTAPVQYEVVTGCTSTVAAEEVGLQPDCAAISGTTQDPTAIYIYVDTESLTTPKVSKEEAVQGMDASWTLSCVVNGAVVTTPGTFDVTAATVDPVYAINLQHAVGSPEPNECAVEDMTVQTALPPDADATYPYTVGVAAVANNATPGAVRQEEGMTGAGAHAVLCADDFNNGNNGTRIQGFECLGDRADSFVQTSTGQLVHNGDCVSLTAGGYAFLARCVANDTLQQWTQSQAGGTVVNMSTGTCLTAPSVKNGIQLTARSCGAAASQKWDIPAATAVPTQPLPPESSVWRAVR